MQVANEAAKALVPLNLGIGQPMCICEHCGEQVALTRCRVSSKILGRFKCRACQVSIVQLRRLHGTWPTDRFNGLDEDIFAISLHSSLSKA